jgi:hypothetical protein
MFKKYLRKRQYAKIKSYIEGEKSVIKHLLDTVPEDGVNETFHTIREAYMAQLVELEQMSKFIENEERR